MEARSDGFPGSTARLQLNNAEGLQSGFIRTELQAFFCYSKNYLFNLSGMELNIISTTVSAGVMLSRISHSCVIPMVPQQYNRMLNLVYVSMHLRLFA